MAQYSVGDPYVQGLSQDRRADYNAFLTRYNVNDNTQANDTTGGLIRAFEKKSVSSLFNFKSPVSTASTLLVIGMVVMLMTCVVLLCVTLINALVNSRAVILQSNLNNLCLCCAGLVAVVAMSAAFIIVLGLRCKDLARHLNHSTHSEFAK